MSIEVTAEAAEHLRDVAIANISELRPYVAIDFLEMMTGIAAYEGRPMELNSYMIDRVASVYFFENEADSATPPPLHAATGPGGAQPPSDGNQAAFEQHYVGGQAAAAVDRFSMKRVLDQVEGALRELKERPE